MSGARETIVFVNGLYHTAATWDRLYRPALEAEFDVVSFDFPNQLAGSDPDFYALDHFADAFLAQLRARALAPEAVHVVGLSSGANVLRALHCERGVDFKSMLLASANPGGLARFYAQVALSQQKALAYGGIPGFTQTTVLVCYSPRYLERTPLAPAVIQERLQELFGTRHDALHTLLRHPAHDPTLATPPGAFRCPVALVFGNDDFFAPRLNVQAYLARCTGPRLQVHGLDGGHSIPFEDPAAVLAILREQVLGEGDLARAVRQV